MEQPVVSDEEMPPMAEDSPSENQEIEEAADSSSNDQESDSEDDQANAKKSPVRVMAQSDQEMGLDDESEEEKP
jgi:hypothetical protein